MNPLVSAIIPNYNYARFVGEAVESALSQSYDNIEVIVVDDGSSDDSLNVLNVFEDRIRILSQQNAGVASARNNGAKESNGELLAFLDADDVWLPHKIEKQVECFLGEGELGLVHVGVQDIDEGGSPLAAHLDGLEGDVSHELLLFNCGVILGGGSGFMIPKKVFDEVGGFDLRLSTSADWDFCYQVSSRFKTGFIPEVLLKYRMHGSNMHGNIALMEREMLIGFEKAFHTNDPTVLKMRRQAYGNLYRVLAGSYFRAGQYARFAQHSAKSLWHSPGNFIHFASYPKRRLQR